MTLFVVPHDRMHHSIHMKATQLRTLLPLLPSHQVLHCQNMLAILTQRDTWTSYYQQHQLQQNILTTTTTTVSEAINGRHIQRPLNGTVWLWRGLKPFQSVETRLVTAILVVNPIVLGNFFIWVFFMGKLYYLYACRYSFLQFVFGSPRITLLFVSNVCMY